MQKEKLVIARERNRLIEVSKSPTFNPKPETINHKP